MRRLAPRAAALRALLLVVLVASAACGPGDPPRTLREACDAIGEHICERWSDCKYPSVGSRCLTTFSYECCYQRDCDVPIPRVSQDAWEDCLDRIDDLRCWLIPGLDYPTLYRIYEYPTSCPSIGRPQP